MGEDPPLRDPTRVVVAGYLLAVVCLLVPLAVIGALFAGIVLIRRGRPQAGAGILALGVLLTVVGLTLLR